MRATEESWKAGELKSWRVESGEWRVESGEWRVESGEWRVESGEDCLLRLVDHAKIAD
jgi:hypothetical protein